MTTTGRKRISVLATVLLVLVFGMGVIAQRGVAEDEAGAGTEKTGKQVGKIVFIDLENSCECTRQRIDGSWNALQTALKEANAALPVERFHVDTQGEQADPYRKLKPMVTVPAIYLLDADGGLVELFQGEVTAEQIGKLLGS